jgi:putative oxidoreductase
MESLVSDPASLGLAEFRIVVGVVMLAHGYNHIFGGGKIAGTARWFENLGMSPGWMHAWAASLIELGAGVLLVLGLLTPLAGAAMIGLLGVALITNHTKNGFFIFHPGEGYEYVLTLVVCGGLLACTGGGRFSVDRALDIFQPPTLTEALISIALGVLGAIGLLVGCWRPDASQAAENIALEQLGLRSRRSRGAVYLVRSRDTIIGGPEMAEHPSIPAFVTTEAIAARPSIERFYVQGGGSVFDLRTDLSHALAVVLESPQSGHGVELGTSGGAK